MPQIPTFTSTASIDAPPIPREDPASAGRAAAAVAAGMDRVSQQFGNVFAQMRQQAAATQALDTASKFSMDADDLGRAFDKDPDPSTVPERFKAAITDLQTKTLGNIDDPQVKEFATNHILQRVPIKYIEVARTAAKRTEQNSIASTRKIISDQTNLLADAANDGDISLATTTIKQAAVSVAALGAVTPEQGKAMVSTAYANAVLQRNTTDPGAAKRLLDQLRPDIDAGTLTQLMEHLRSPLMRQDASRNAAIANAPEVNAMSTARAQAVHDGLVERGLPDVAAWGLAANALHESGGNPGAPAGDPDGGGGLFQWRGDRLTAFTAKYGITPMQATLDQQLDFAMGELGGSEGAAGAALRAAKTPGEAGSIGSKLFLRPKDTEGQATGRAATAERLAGGATRPSLGEVIARADQLSAGKSDEERALTRSHAIETWHQNDAAFAVQRETLRPIITDLSALYRSGLTDREPPEAQIRTAFPPEQAQPIIEGLRITRQAGDVFRAVRWASPADEQDARAKLAVTPANEDAGKTGLRLRLLGEFDGMIREKHERLQRDPFAYTLTNPDMVRTLQAADPNNPATLAPAIDLSRTLQRQLGLREDQLRSLTNDQVGRLAAAINTTDPAKADLGQAIDGYQKQFGRFWPGVAGELVKHGKVPPWFEMLAQMDLPEQAVQRQDAQRALVFVAEHGNEEKLRDVVGRKKMQAITDNIDGKMDDFVGTTTFSTGGLQLASRAKEMVRTLATYYAYRGDTDALDHAYDAVIGQKYEISGTMRAPKPIFDAARHAAWDTQNNLDAGDLAEMQSSKPLEPARRAAFTVDAARNGKWIPSADDGGWVLMAPLRNGGAEPLLRKNGKPVEIRFDALPEAQPPRFGTSTP